MEESLSGSHFECSKTSPSSQQHDDQDGISESGENDEESTKPAHNQNGGSSSNSTIDESEKKTSSSVRPYVRSKMPRLRWTPDLHLRFINAVERLGGQERATPKLVLQHMNIKGLSIAHVKSHLQMYRSKKTDNPGQVLGDHRYLVDCGDRNIYNLSQLPMLQGYNQNHNSSFRYGHDNVSWNGCGNLRHSRSPAFYGTSAEKISGSNTNNWTRNCTTSTFNFPTTNISSFNEHSSSSWKIHKLKSDHEFQPYNTAREFSNPRRFTTTPIINFDPISTHLQANKADHRELITSFNNNFNDRLLDSKAIASSNVQDWKKLKRKASDCNLDLDLSLRITSSRKIIDDQNPKTSREVDGDVDSNLSLSLYSSTCPKLSRLKKLEEAAEDETKKRASTLDLTI